MRTVYLPSKAFQAKSPGDGEIRADGIVRIIVGGNVAGLISNKGSSKIFVVGNFEGRVVTGDPSTLLSISGNYAGDLSYSTSQGSLLRLIIEGYMPYDKIRDIQALKYTQVTVFVSQYNTEEGFLVDGRISRQMWYMASEAENRP